MESEDKKKVKQGRQNILKFKKNNKIKNKTTTKKQQQFKKMEI